MPTRMLVADGIVSQFLYHLLADRAARVAEVARLQADYEQAAIVAATTRRLEVAAEAQVAEMRPLVEAVAAAKPRPIHPGWWRCDFCRAMANVLVDFPHADGCHAQAARALAATWQTPAAPPPETARRPRYERLQDGGIGVIGTNGLIYEANAGLSEAEWGALLALLNDGHDDLSWEEIEPLVAERVKRNTTPAAPTPDGQEGGEDDA
jgi:hypothetical protein